VAASSSWQELPPEVEEEEQEEGQASVSQRGPLLPLEPGPGLEDVLEHLGALHKFFANCSFFAAVWFDHRPWARLALVPLWTDTLAASSRRLRRALEPGRLELRNDLARRCTATTLDTHVAEAPSLDSDVIRALGSSCGEEAFCWALCHNLQRAGAKSDEKRGMVLVAAFVEAGLDLAVPLPAACCRRLRLVHARNGDALLDWLCQWGKAEAEQLEGGFRHKALSGLVRSVAFFFPRSRRSHRCAGPGCICHVAAVVPPPRTRRLGILPLFRRGRRR